MSDKKEPLKLKPSVARYYELKGIAEAGTVSHYGGRMINLSQIDNKMAKELAEDKRFPYLLKKGSTDTDEPPEDSK